MIYPFECPKCFQYKEVQATVENRPDTIQCEDCKIPMKRIFTAPEIGVSKTGYYDPALGINVNRKSDVKEALNRMAGEYGINAEPIGDTPIAPAPVKHDLASLTDELASQGVFDNVDSAKKSIYDD